MWNYTIDETFNKAFVYEPWGFYYGKSIYDRIKYVNDMCKGHVLGVI